MVIRLLNNTSIPWNRNSQINKEFLPFQAVHSICGNGVKEPGEECDCGTPEVTLIHPVISIEDLKLYLGYVHAFLV